MTTTALGALTREELLVDVDRIMRHASEAGPLRSGPHR